MVAVFTGNGLGLFNASLAGAGAGFARSGQGTDRQYVNVANGNLVFQSQDEQLLFRGTALGTARTYNSLGTTAQVGADGWVTGFERRVELQQGQMGQAGSIMRRHTGDGGYQDFVYAAPNVYLSTSGEGAHDQLTFAPGTATWTYVEGTSRATEAYAALDDAQARGRLLTLSDGRSNAVSWIVDYDTQGRIVAIRDADSLAALRYTYDAMGRLQQIEVQGEQPGQVGGRVSYGYDALGRLSWSLVDLTPESAADRAEWNSAGGNDGLLYRTSYAYEGDSLRISLVRQSDGTLMSYGYDGQGRVVTATVGDDNANDADGVGQTVTYRYDSNHRRTDVSDATGATWSYEFDAEGRLTRIELPARDGMRDVTRYAYDGDGNITQVATLRGAQTLQQTDFSYDAQGNVVWQWERAAADGGARAIQRTYSASNQIISETRYTGLDADGAGTADAPTGGMTTVYLYDGQDRLRFLVSPTGDVHEYTYHAVGTGIGQLASERTYADLRYDGAIALAGLATWAASQAGAAGSRADLSYDLWGRLADRTDYARVDAAGNGIMDNAAVNKHYTYDAQGRLLAALTLRGPSSAQVRETETYRYDGLGRLLSEVRRSDATLLSSSTWNYLDSGMSIRVTSGVAGTQRVMTELRDQNGRTVSVTTSSGDASLGRTSRNYYDGYGRLRASEDAAGGRRYYFYDNQGQLVAEVGPTGTAISYERDAFGRIVATTAHASALNTAAWIQAGAVNVSEWSQYRPAAHASDRVVHDEYDTAGLRLRSLDADGNQMVYRYDGAGQLLQVTRLDAAGNLDTARTIRYFHDGNGRQVAALDAAGYLTEQVYDAAGRLVRTVAYATVVSTALRANGTLAAMRPTTSAQDQVTRNFYDGLNRLVGVLDAEGYLSDVVYDSTNSVRATRSYAARLEALTGTETLRALLARAEGGGARETRITYDAMGRAIREVNAEGTVTQYQYDTLGQLIATQVAAGTSEIREGHLRYDALGNLIGELSGNGATQLMPGMTEAQLDTIYAQYGVRHVYDALGLRTESIDSEGNRTWYFHDAAGRLTQTVRGTNDAQGVANAAGEVTETRYDVFGQVIDNIVYVGRLVIPNPGSRASVASAISTLQFVSGTDIRVQMEYDRRGQLASTIDARGNRRRYEYNAFGEQTFDRLDLGQDQQRVTQSIYDARGQRTAQVAGAGAAQTSQSWIYDAFGRVISSTDGRGQARQLSYDRLGRQVSSWQTVNGVEQRHAQTYDAFDRVLTSTDAEGGTTTYSYDDATSTVTARSPEGLVITTAHGRHGQVTSITDGLGNTTRYEYDASGNQTAIVSADGSRQTQSFTTRNLLASTTDASGRSVVYTYDAAGRLLKRTVDPQGLNLTTSYGYDAAGRQLSMVDARGIETRSRFDGNGNLVESIFDPAGLALRTTYSWDAAGQQLSVSTGMGTAQVTTTTYAYDVLGRRISQTVDAGQERLNLLTQYRYDQNGNVAARIDPAGKVTRFVYDADNRVELSVDAAGGVTRYWYDRAGRVLAQRRYATAIALSGLPEATTAAQIQARLAADDTRDIQVYSVYDRDGQLRLTLNGVGAVAGYERDASGRAVREIRYANAVAIAELRAALLTGDVDAVGVLSRITLDDSRDAVSWQVRDALGRTRFEIAADGSVMERRYDASGIQVATVSYANCITLTAALRLDLAGGNADVQAVATRLSASALDQSQYVVLDSAGRVRFEVRRDADGQGRVSEYGYLDNTRASTTFYARTVAFDSQQTVAALQALVAPLHNTGEYRTERVVLDAAGRQRFAIDASGAVRETRYDAVGQAVASLAYQLKPGAQDAQSLASLAAWAAGQATDQVRLDTRGYDGAGRAVLHTNALGQTEHFGYDAAGQLTSFADTAGQVWGYVYNAAGLRTSETSPAVDVATVGSDGQFTIAHRSLVTRTEYDALGNVVRRSEDADGGAPRITEYQYDNRGNQVRVLFPDPWVIDEGTGLLVASGQRSTVEVSYDALNRAVVQKDVRGTYTYKVYDVLGQLAYDVDGEGYVTSYAYDAYGNQTGLRRFATALQTGALSGWTAGTALSQSQLRDGGGLVAGTADRQLLTSYDSLGQKVQTLSSEREYYGADGIARQGTPTVRYQYDGYGSLQRLSELLVGLADHADAQWAHTWHYYDAVGRTVMTVDAEGYATATEYTSTGEVASQTEHARALSTQLLGPPRPAAPAPGDAITGFDRRTSYTYDALGRKITQTATRQFQRADGSAGQSGVQTRIGYDALGRVIQSSDENGTTTTGYDALGRVTSVREPERAALRGTAQGQLDASVATDLSSNSLREQISPYTTTVYDAFGNAVQMRRYASGWATGQAAPIVDDTRDQLQTMQYDGQGRLVRSADALGSVQMHRYDAADKVVRTRQLLAGSSAERNAVVITEFSYDRSGRQLSTLQKRSIGGGEQPDLSETVRYNGFGEIVGKTHGGLAGELLYGYDAGGNMVQSNESGTEVRLGYNLAGYQVRQSRSSWNGQSTVAAVTTIQTDRLGRALRTDMPSFNGDANAVTNVARQFDRWGNVTQIIDARGYQTNYQYNSFNQITRDERPLVEVVGETGARNWVRPVNEWFYDVFGRLVATRDANGHMRSSEYDAAGQLVKSRDAVGAITLYAYDALGNQRLQQNALGYVTFKQYDRLGRVTAVGDYLLNDAGTARYRTTLQQYRLNENGDRLAVTDALGYTALYDYDSRHLVVRSQTAMGVTQQYGYDVLGRKIVESNALSSPWGADRDGQQVRRNELSWTYDIFGRTRDHNDLSTRDFNYDYASTGQLVMETGNGGQVADTTRTYQYYPNGQLRRIEEGGGNFTYYEYDAAGNKTLEEIYTRDGAGALVHTYTRTWYDSHNRIQRVVQDDASAGGNARRMFDIRYDYDAVGNRRRVLAQSSHGPNAAAIPAANTAPTAVKQVADRTVRKGIQSEFNILFTDVFRDAEQDALTLDITQADGSPLPSWLGARYNAATGEIIFTAAPPESSGDTDIAVKLTARETANAGNSAATVFTVRSRTNAAPRQLNPGIGQLNAKTGQAWAAELPASMYFIDDDLGDMLSLSLENVSLPSWLKADLSNPFVLRLSGTPPVDGSMLLRIRATDQSGASVIKVLVLKMAANAGPNVVSTPSLGEAVLGYSYSWSQSLSQLFVDPNGDSLQVRASGLPTWLSFTFLDGASPVLRLDGNVPSTEVDGATYAVTLTATDPDGQTSSVTLQLVIRANRAPVLAAQVPQQWLWRNAPWSMQIPANTFVDPNGDSLSWSVSGLPSGLNFDAATRTIFGTTGTIGAFSIIVSVNDGRGGNSATSFVINVGVAAPVYNGGLPSRLGQQGEYVSWPLPSGAFTHPNNDPLQYSILIERPGYNEWVWNQGQREWVTRWVPPSWGLSQSLSIDAVTGTITGVLPTFSQPTHPITGGATVYLPDFRVKIIASDGNATSEATFTATVNYAPWGSEKDRDIKSNMHYSMKVYEFGDANKDILNYSVAGLPPGMWFDSTQMTINGSAAQGTYTVTITANDGRGGVGSETFVLNVVPNNAPRPPAIGTMSMQVGTGVGVSLPEFSDPDWDEMTYSMGPLPPGLWFDEGSRMLSGTPTQAGSYTLTYYAADGRGGTSQTSFVINVAAAPVPNRAPYVNRQPQQPVWHFYSTNAHLVDPSGFSLPPDTFLDPDNNPLSYSIIRRPDFLNYWYDPAYGHQFSGINNDTRPYVYQEVTIRATDPSGLYVDMTFIITTEYYDFMPGGPGGGVVDPQRASDPRLELARTDESPLAPNASAGRLGADEYANHSAVNSPGVPASSWAGLVVKEAQSGGRLIPALPPGEDGRPSLIQLQPLPTSARPAPDAGSTAGMPVANGAIQAAAAPAVVAWSGPVNIAGGTLPSGSGQVSTANGTGSVPVETKEYWYTYDGENRILVNNGKLENGQIVLVYYGEGSYSLAYDAAGNIVSRKSDRSTTGESFYWIDRTAYDLRGNRLYEYYTDAIRNGQFESGGGVRRKLSYDASNHLTASMTYYASDSVWEDRTPEGPGYEYESWGFYYYGGWLAGAETYAYDGDGRITVQQTLYREFEDWSWLKHANDAGGRQSTDLSVLQFQSGTDYSGGYDAAGRLNTYRYVTPQYTHTYTTQYEGRESWLQKSVTGTSTNSNYRTTTNTLSYDAFGRLVSQRETTPLRTGSIDDRMRYYANDMDGKVVNRREGTLTSNGAFSQEGVGGPGNFRLVQAAGQQIAELKEGFQGVFGGRPYTTTQIQSVAGRGHYDAGGGQVVAQAGDTLRTIAQRVYGTDQMWYVLADANGFGNADAEIGAGTRIITPEASVNRNDSGTFKPYDPTSATGSTTPGLPYIPPPPRQQCGALSKVISIVVQVVVTAVVTYYTGNAQAGAAAGAAAGNHAGQVSALMLNGQFDWSRWASYSVNPFQGNSNDLAVQAFDPVGNGAPGMIDYKSIGVSAAAAASASYAGAYVGGVTNNAYAGAAAQAATSYAANYQYSKWGGYDASWSNRGVLQNVGTAVMSQGIQQSGLFKAEARPQLNGSTAAVASSSTSMAFSWTSIARNTALNFVTGAASYGLGKALGTGEHWNSGDALADAFGNALGTEVAGASERRLGRGAAAATLDIARINGELSERSSESLIGGGQMDMPTPQGRNLADSGIASMAARVSGPRLTTAEAYGSWSDDVTYQAAGGSGWTRSPNLSYDARLQNSATGEWALTTPTVQVRPDIQQSSDFMHYWSYARSNGLPAPSRVDAGSLGAYRYAMDALTRPAWNAWASQNQGFYRDQGYGPGGIREPGLVFKRDDMRDLVAMGVFIRAGAKALVNDGVATLQTAPIFEAYRGITGAGMWQPFEIRGSLEEAGALSLRLASVFVGGGATSASRPVRMLSEIGTLERATPAAARMTGPGAAASLDNVAQMGGASGFRFPHTEGLATHASVAELRTSGALPGELGVILTDRTVRFGDIYELGTLGGRNVEFSLVTERVDGLLVKKLYSGDAWASPVPRNSRLIGHVHPNENAFKMWPSPQDMNTVNARYFRDLKGNPSAKPTPTRIFWGAGDADNTIFYPGFGKFTENRGG